MEADVLGAPAIHRTYVLLYIATAGDARLSPRNTLAQRRINEHVKRIGAILKQALRPAADDDAVSACIRCLYEPAG